MTPNPYVYLDYYQEEPEIAPTTIGGYNTLKKTNSYNPVPDDADELAKKHIIGIQGNIWREYMQTSERTDYQAFPRAMAIAETAWTQNANKDWKNFCERMVTEFERLKVMNTQPCLNFFDVNINTHADENGPLMVLLESFYPDANNPGTTLGEQDFLRSLPDSVDFVVLTNADNLSVYDKEDISKLKRTGTKFLYYKNLSEFYDQCEETENLEEFKTKMNAALKNGESDEFDGYYVQFGRAGSMMHVDFFNEVTTAIREKLAAIGGPKANNGKLVFFDGIVTFTVDYSGRYEEPFIDLVDYFVDGQIVLLESSLEIKLNMSQPVGFYGKMPKEKVITTATPPTDDGKTGIISREDLDVIQTSEGMAYIINHFITGLGNNGPLAGVSIYNANEDYLATDGVTNYRRIRDAIQKLNPSPIN